LQYTSDRQCSVYDYQIVTKDTIKRLARSVGFELAGVAAAEPTLEALFYPQWLGRGYAGDMAYLTGRRGEMRQNPKTLLPDARSIICVGLVYNTPEPYSVEVEADGRGWISRYAWGEDYHTVVRAKLQALAGAIENEHGPFHYKACVDTAPLLERAYAQQAGLGWIAKNTCLINQQLGSWVFLGELITSLDLEPDGPAAARCGTCTRCIDACPTGALVPAGDPGGPEYALDARRCISYWTIELRGTIPEENRAAVGQHLFGCDICQDVCPWNRRAAVSEASEFQARNSLPNLGELAEMTPERFRSRFGNTAVERSRYRGFLRNVAVALGNSGNRDFLEPLRRLARHDDPVVREHAQWAISRIEQDGRESSPFRDPAFPGKPSLTKKPETNGNAERPA
jgi:epoxyqueuosine reductase